MTEVEELARDPRVFKVQGPMCNWNLKGADDEGRTGYVRKETIWLTSSEELAKTLQGVCQNMKGRTMHRHVHLIGGKARTSAAAAYTPELVNGVLKAFRRQLHRDGDEMVLRAFDAGAVPDSTDWWDEPENQEWAWRAWDDINNEELDPVKVMEARQEEIDYIRGMQVFKAVPKSECPGKPITMKWIDTRKQSGRYRSRLVCREIKKAKRSEDKLDPADVFSAMPPVESLKMLISEWMTTDDGHNHEDFIMATFDISRAHFAATQDKRDVYATLPEGFEQEGHVAKLLKAMYGTEDAANLWGETWARQLEENGIKIGIASRALFCGERHKGLCHGDDFLVLCRREHLSEFQKILEDKFEAKKTGVIGFSEKDEKTLEILNREIRIVGNDVVELEADPRHAEKLIEELGLQNANTVATPRVKYSDAEHAARESSPFLVGADITKYRSCTMRLKYIEQDRLDLSEAVKCLAQNMAKPRQGHMVDLKRLGRYLKGHQRAILKYRLQSSEALPKFHFSAIIG